MPGKSEFEFTFGSPRPDARRAEEDPFRILVIGDFSGRASRGISEPGDMLAMRRIHRADVENIEATLDKLGAEIRIASGEGNGDPLTIPVRELDDLHPDALYDRLPVFASLAQSTSRPEPVAPTPEPASSEPASPESAGGGDFASLLDGEVRPEGEKKSGVDISDFIRKVVGDPGAAAAPAEPARPAGDAITAEMRRILHHPEFRALEAAWRGLHRLVTSVETDEILSIHLLDATRDEIFEDLRAAREDLSGSGLYRLLVQSRSGTLGGQPWSVIAMDLTVDAEPEDVGLLAALGAIASHAGSPLLVGAGPRLLGVDSIADGPGPEVYAPYAELRRSQLAPWIGLALPRFLLRLPYGRKTDEIDRFEFEEVGDGYDPDEYLWGTPAFGLAELLARSFTERGSRMEPGDHLDLEDLPQVIYEEDGERKLVPGAGVLLPERIAQMIAAEGLMPLMSYKDRNAVRLFRFQSIADPAAPLAGRWV